MAVLQNYARQKGLSVDSLTFDFKVMSSDLEASSSLADIKERFSVKEAAFKVWVAIQCLFLIFSVQYSQTFLVL